VDYPCGIFLRTYFLHTCGLPSPKTCSWPEYLKVRGGGKGAVELCVLQDVDSTTSKSPKLYHNIPSLFMCVCVRVSTPIWRHTVCPFIPLLLKSFERNKKSRTRIYPHTLLTFSLWTKLRTTMNHQASTCSQIAAHTQQQSNPFWYDHQVEIHLKFNKPMKRFEIYDELQKLKCPFQTKISSIIQLPGLRATIYVVDRPSAIQIKENLMKSTVIEEIKRYGEDEKKLILIECHHNFWTTTSWKSLMLMQNQSE